MDLIWLVHGIIVLSFRQILLLEPAYKFREGKLLTKQQLQAGGKLFSALLPVAINPTFKQTTL
jgi:hypothetical protein